MIKRINAFRTVFNFLLTLVELLIGVRFLLETFGSTESSNQLLIVVRLTLEQMGAVGSGALAGSGIEKPVAALLLVLGFMLFSFVLITVAPAMAVRKERELELADD